MKWISVNDRLPEYSEQVLIPLLADMKVVNNALRGYSDIVIGFRQCTDVNGEKWSTGSVNKGITHWMPLPELPEKLYFTSSVCSLSHTSPPPTPY